MPTSNLCHQAHEHPIPPQKLPSELSLEPPPPPPLSPPPHTCHFLACSRIRSFGDARQRLEVAHPIAFAKTPTSFPSYGIFLACRREQFVLGLLASASKGRITSFPTNFPTFLLFACPSDRVCSGGPSAPERGASHPLPIVKPIFPPF